MRCTESELMVRLDGRGVDVWTNERGWFWARRSELKAAAPKFLGAPIAANPVAGPYGSLALALRSAANREGVM
jgi:hypothetical protein